MSSIENLKTDIDNINAIAAIPSMLEVICRTTGMGFAAVARVTEDRWVACSVRDEIQFGLEPGGELKLETTICHEIRQSGEGVVIDHVSEDQSFVNHHTPAMYGFQSYISLPIIRKDGTFFGTLCAIDPKPARLKNPETIGMFKLFAELISFHLNAIEQVAIAEQRLEEEYRIAELREQFIAILGHDLRNPVGAISSSAQLLQRMGLEPRATRLANIIKDSSYRMNGLIENILDFARGRLGDGIKIEYDNGCIKESLNQVITELQSIWTDRVIEANLDFSDTVECDAKRVAQLFSNILGNALTHGDPAKKVIVDARVENNEFYLSVSNEGDKIPEHVMANIFQPFSRKSGDNHQQGLGLGLFIASEIANAHGGTLSVVSDEQETCFTLRIPAQKA